MRRSYPLLSVLVLQACNANSIGELALGLSSVDHAFVQESALEGSVSQSDATHPVGSYAGSMYSFPNDPNSYVWGFGGITKGWWRNLTSQGWRLNGDDTWLTDANNSWLDIPPANGRAGFGLVGLANGKILAVGGRNQGVIDGGVPFGDIDTADVFDPVAHIWSNLATLPNPWSAATGGCCYGTGCDASCAASSTCTVANCAIVNGPQKDGSQEVLPGSSLAPKSGRYALFVGGLLGKESTLPTPSFWPNGGNGQKFSAMTNNAIYYDQTTGAFSDVPAVAISYPVPANCATTKDCGNPGQTCSQSACASDGDCTFPQTCLGGACTPGLCTPGNTYQAGAVYKCVALNNGPGQKIMNGYDQVVCFAGRTVFGTEWSFPYGNTAQIFTPGYANASGSPTWQLCAATNSADLAARTNWGMAIGEDDNSQADFYTHGRANAWAWATSNFKVLLGNGVVRTNDNHAMAGSKAIRMFDPSRCGASDAYTILATRTLVPRSFAPLVQLTNIDPTGDTALVIGGDQGNSTALGGTPNLPNYQTERLVWSPSTNTIGADVCDANLPTQLVNSQPQPLNGAFAAIGLLLNNGHIAYYAGAENCPGGCPWIGSPYMMTTWEPGVGSCSP
jgi:hypothetical protein